MKKLLFGFVVVGIFLASMARTAFADDARDEAIKKDRKQIEGTWRVITLEINGNKASEADARKITVVNGSDGTWSIRSEGKEISKGTSTIDPTKKLKTLNFIPTEGKGKAINTLGFTNSVRKPERCVSLHPERNGPPSLLPHPAVNIYS